MRRPLRSRSPRPRRLRPCRPSPRPPRHPWANLKLPWMLCIAGPFQAMPGPSSTEPPAGRPSRPRVSPRQTRMLSSRLRRSASLMDRRCRRQRRRKILRRACLPPSQARISRASPRFHRLRLGPPRSSKGGMLTGSHRRTKRATAERRSTISLGTKTASLVSRAATARGNPRPTRAEPAVRGSDYVL